MADIKDIRKKGDGELARILKEKQAALRDFRFAGAGGRTRNVREGRTLRREIAQIQTVMGEPNARKQEKDVV